MPKPPPPPAPPRPPITTAPAVALPATSERSAADGGGSATSLGTAIAQVAGQVDAGARRRARRRDLGEPLFEPPAPRPRGRRVDLRERDDLPLAALAEAEAAALADPDPGADADAGSHRPLPSRRSRGRSPRTRWIAVDAARHAVKRLRLIPFHAPRGRSSRAVVRAEDLGPSARVSKHERVRPSPLRPVATAARHDGREQRQIDEAGGRRWTALGRDDSTRPHGPEGRRQPAPPRSTISAAPSPRASTSTSWSRSSSRSAATSSVPRAPRSCSAIARPTSSTSRTWSSDDPAVAETARGHALPADHGIAGAVVHERPLDPRRRMPRADARFYRERRSA